MLTDSASLDHNILHSVRISIDFCSTLVMSPTLPPKSPVIVLSCTLLYSVVLVVHPVCYTCALYTEIIRISAPTGMGFLHIFVLM